MSYSEVTQNRDVRKNFLITGELNQKLQDVAKRKYMSQNEIVNKALESYLKRFN